MRAHRLTLAGLLAWVALMAVGFAALRSPSALWANTLYSVWLAVFTLASLAIVYRRGQRRAFWVGFVTCGGVYASFAMIGPWYQTQSGRLVTTAILDLAYPHVVPPPAAPPGAIAPSARNGRPSNAARAVRSGIDGRASARARSLIVRTGGFGGVPPPPPPPPDRWGFWTEPDRSIRIRPMATQFLTRCPTSYLVIGHVLFSLLAALVGAYITRQLYLTRNVPEPTESRA